MLLNLFSSLSLTLLNRLLNSLSISFERPLNCICTYVGIKVNLFIQKSIDYIHNYVQKSVENCLFLFILSFIQDIA